MGVRPLFFVKLVATSYSDLDVSTSIYVQNGMKTSLDCSFNGITEAELAVAFQPQKLCKPANRSEELPMLEKEQPEVHSMPWQATSFKSTLRF
jgi:hypothetical protein